MKLTTHHQLEAVLGTAFLEIWEIW